MSKRDEVAHSPAAHDGASVFPMIREISANESRALLGRHHVGRIAVSLDDPVDILPIHYVFDRGWRYGRTSRGGKFATLARHAVPYRSILFRVQVGELTGRATAESESARVAFS